jgi:hypothetical protein
MNPLSASDVFLTVTIMSITFLVEVGFFILVGMFWKERALWAARSRYEGLVLWELDGWDRPSSIMTFDGNPEPVQFIQPNVLDRACLSVGKDDTFADQFGLRRTVLIQDFWRTDLHRWHCWSMFGRAVCAVPRRLNGEACPNSNAQRPEWLMVTALLIPGAGWFAF